MQFLKVLKNNVFTLWLTLINLIRRTILEISHIFAKIIPLTLQPITF